MNIGFFKTTKLLGGTEIGLPSVGCTQTFITGGGFKTREEAANLQKYIKTRFARAILGILKVTQHNPPVTFRLVPQQIFSLDSDIDWSKSIAEIDEQLFDKYRLTITERLFIRTHLEMME